MGNHQFGFTHRPPEFIGKSWSYITEKRRKFTAMRRPTSELDFSKTLDKEILDLDRMSRNRRGSSAPSETPSKTPKSKGKANPKHSWNTVRCSPTAPDAVTLSVDLAGCTLGVAGLSVGPDADKEAVASALNAIQKLTPAAPRLFQEPVFDDYFEEAERRNLTIEALQAALNSPSPSDGKEVKKTSSDRVSYDPKHGSLASTSPEETAIRANTDKESGPAVLNEIEKPEVSRASTSDQALSSPHSKGRFVVLVTGGSVEAGDINESNRWDNCPPTIIVQPAPESLFLPSTASMSSLASCLDGCLSPRVAGSRRTSAGPRPGQLPGARLTQSGSTESEEGSHSDILMDAIRQKRRANLRRKTVGILTNLPAADALTMSEPESGLGKRPTPTASMTRLPQRSDERRKDSAVVQQALRKKSLSKSDLLCPPPIISLLRQPQINLIRQLWQQLYNTKGPTVLGNHIFQRVFFKNPQIKEVFRVADLGNQHFNVDSMCKAHAKSVAGVLDDVVKNLENLREVEGKLMQVGRKHAIFNDLGFYINFWSVFAEAFIDCTLEWGEKSKRVEESRKAWAIIIAYITDKMKFGFQEARRNLLRPGGRKVRLSDDKESAIEEAPIS